MTASKRRPAKKSNPQLDGGFPGLSFSHTSTNKPVARILITSGPTRQHLDPIRYLTNASSGRMGAALAAAAVAAGHKVTVVSGPVEIAYPRPARVHHVETTEEMAAACLAVFPSCDGLIAAAAPCDYRPVVVAPHKIRKTGKTLRLELVETSDIVATLAAIRTTQWLVAFALETEDPRIRALQKLERKQCDLIVVNGPTALRSTDTSVEVLDRSGLVLGAFSGSKRRVARSLLRLIGKHLIVSPR
jgi:phosphopantothenoylcysteine decarboxylase/phosphopantothenate--cysteine ligase